MFQLLTYLPPASCQTLLELTPLIAGEYLCLWGKQGAAVTAVITTPASEMFPEASHQGSSVPFRAAIALLPHSSSFRALRETLSHLPSHHLCIRESSRLREVMFSDRIVNECHWWEVDVLMYCKNVCVGASVDVGVHSCTTFHWCRLQWPHNAENACVWNYMDF